MKGRCSMTTVVLKNGATEVLPLVNVTMVSLNSLLGSSPMGLYELLEKCRNKDHKIFGNLGDDLIDLALLQDNGQPHGSIKNIVLSAVSGEGLGMVIGNPIDKKTER